MIFLGTGAAELIPNPYCSCPVCTEALLSKDRKMKRNRSSFMLDEHSLIDCGPDILSSCGEFGVSLANLRNVFVTHTHEDHFSVVSLMNMLMNITEIPELSVFVSPEAYAGLQLLRELIIRYQDEFKIKESIERLERKCRFIPFQPFENVRIGDMTVSAVIGNHTGNMKNEKSLNYIFEKNGKTLFYAADTGLFFEEAYEWLKTKRIDTLVIECTFGVKEIDESNHHVNGVFLQRVLDRLIVQGTLKDSADIYLTHFSHKGYSASLEKRLQQKYGRRLSFAYDGLTLPDL